MARIVFLGTPEFAVPALRALAAAHEVVAVVTQPDRAGGRGCRLLYEPAVKREAEALGLFLLQPCSLRRERAVVAALRALAPDLMVLAAFGQILRPEVLAIPTHGCLGVHASLLPRWRGAAPIAAAIRHGDAETGITLMLTDAGMDTGPIIAQRELAIAPDDTTATLTTRLAHLGAALLLDTLPAWLAGEITPQSQDAAHVTLAPMIEKSEGAIVWARPAEEIARLVRAFTPWPGAFTTWHGQGFKVLRARPDASWSGAEEPGTVIAHHGSEIAVATGAGALVLETVQLAGKKALEAGTFARGQRGFVGSVLGGAA